MAKKKILTSTIECKTSLSHPQRYQSPPLDELD